MFVRMAHFKLLREHQPAAIDAYNRDGIPKVRAQPGNVDCYLLEPVPPAEHFVACTLWESEEHAKAYESSGVAQEVAGTVRFAFDGPPELRTYRARREA